MSNFRPIHLLSAAATLAAALSSCGGAAPQGPAARCADVVRIHKGLDSVALVKGNSMATPEGSVEIKYQGTQDGVLPAKGTAACTFAVEAGGAASLLQATVDGRPLGKDEIASIRRQLGEGG